KRWTARIVYDLMAKLGEKVETLGDVHRRAIIEARKRGLSYREMAIAFNEKGIPRRKDSRHPWTERNLAYTWSKLHLRHNRQHKGSTDTEQSEPVVLKKSA